MLFEKRYSEYLIYAIGEMVLIVLGILIALGIKGYDQTIKERKFEQHLNSRIHQEYNQNKKLLNQRINSINQSTNSTHELMKLMNKDLSYLNTKTIDSLIYYSIHYVAYNPLTTTLTEITQTGKIEIISNQKLKDLLYQWSIEFENNRSTFKIFEKWVEDGVLPYLSKNIALKNIDKFGQLKWKENSEFDSDYDKVFKDREFENILENHLYLHSLMSNDYQKLESIIKEILKITEYK